MLRILRRGQRYIMAAVILLVGGAFVFFFGVGGPVQPTGAGDAVVVVDDIRFGADDFLRVRARQESYFQQVLGASFDPAKASEQLDLAARNALIQQGILAREAERLGLSISRDEMRDTIRRLYRNEEGRFDRKGFRDYAEYEFGSERRLLKALERDLLARKALALIGEAADVSRAEAEAALRVEGESVRIAYVALDPAEGIDPEAVGEEEALAFAEAHEDRLRALYDQRRDRYDRPPQVRARHILLSVPENADEKKIEEVRQELLAIRQRILDGADFAEVAAEVSDDLGTRQKGGDLGFFGRNQMVKAFEDAAFSLEPGVLSEPIRTPFGFHLIRVEEKREARKIPFEEARLELARELVARERRESEIDALAERLLGDIRRGETLESVARMEKLTLERPDPVKRRPDGFIPGLGAAPEVLRVAFTLRPEAPTPARVFRVGEKRVLIQLLEREEPAPEEIAAAVEAKREELLTRKRQQVQTAWLAARQAELQGRGELVVDLSRFRTR